MTFFSTKNDKGQLHSHDDTPAIHCSDGTKYWYRNGLLHRDGDKPAYENANGSKAWYRDGLFHRDGDNPAAISADGNKFWYKDGKLHRDGGKPAVDLADGTREWFIEGAQCSPWPLVVAYRIKRPGLPGWICAGTTTDDVVDAIRTEMDAHECLSAESRGSILIEAYETTQEEMDSLPNFDGW